jgi:hypothetical protein
VIIFKIKKKLLISCEKYEKRKEGKRKEVGYFILLE